MPGFKFNSDAFVCFIVKLSPQNVLIHITDVSPPHRLACKTRVNSCFMKLSRGNDHRFWTRCTVHRFMQLKALFRANESSRLEKTCQPGHTSAYCRGNLALSIGSRAWAALTLAAQADPVYIGWWWAPGAQVLLRLYVLQREYFWKADKGVLSPLCSTWEINLPRFPRG